MILKQDGNKLTGSGGPNENGKLEGERLTVEVPTGKGAMQFVLQVKGDGITGGMKRGGGDARESAKVSLKSAADK